MSLLIVTKICETIILMSRKLIRKQHNQTFDSFLQMDDIQALFSGLPKTQILNL
jgi:hypothetical protein